MGRAHPRLSRTGNRFVRGVVWMLAVGAIRHPGPYRDYFLRRTVAGKNKMDSLVAIGRTILASIYAILKTGRACVPAYAAPRAAPRGAVASRGGFSICLRESPRPDPAAGAAQPSPSRCWPRTRSAPCWAC